MTNGPLLASAWDDIQRSDRFSNTAQRTYPNQRCNAPSVVTGTVTGATASGQSVVQTSAGEIALSAQKPLPRGTQLTLQITNTPQVPGGLPEPLRFF